jgi:hypothetical protein
MQPEQGAIIQYAARIRGVGFGRLLFCYDLLGGGSHGPNDQAH